MISIDGRFGYAKRHLSLILTVTLLTFHVSLVFPRHTFADMTEAIRKCAAESDKDKRLACYDKLFRKTESANIAPRPATISEKKGAIDCTKISLMEKRWDLKSECRDNAQRVKWYNPNYFLFAAYNNTPNRNTMLDADPRAKAQNTEAVFQLSGKLRPLPDGLLGDKLDFWAGYTQISFWQLYNSAFSAPFRDTNYAPEGFFTYRIPQDPSRNPDRLNLRIINAGFVHQSNGRSRPLSRSWNRLFTEFGFEKIFDKQERGRNELNLFVKAWYRLPENALDDDNPDIEKYMGYGEIRAVYYREYCRFGMMLRNNLRADNKGAIQLDVSLPFSIFSDKSVDKADNNISLYFQYFNGYGESLLDYNSSSDRISAGVMITDW